MKRVRSREEGRGPAGMQHRDASISSGRHRMICSWANSWDTAISTNTPSRMLSTIFPRGSPSDRNTSTKQWEMKTAGSSSSESSRAVRSSWREQSAGRFSKSRNTPSHPANQSPSRQLSRQLATHPDHTAGNASSPRLITSFCRETKHARRSWNHRGF